MTSIRSFWSSALALSAIALVAEAAGANNLAGEPSQFLRAHASDAIEWTTWGEAAFNRAKTEQKPIYVFAGSFTNELSRAMQKQSFANAQIVAALNRDFVCVILDRDEHPELANAFQLYLQSNKQVKGWPVNIWLTPDLKPFDGAAYLPPSEEWGKEGIVNYVKRIEAEWKDGRDQLGDKTEEAISNLGSLDASEAPSPYSPTAAKTSLQAAADAWMETYDSAHAAFGDAPHYLEPELLRFLLRSPGKNRDAAFSVLRAIDRSALHDPLDGGFFRRSVDAAWQFPSFQKTAGDQARIALAYLDAAELTDDASFGRAAQSALDYALARLRTDEGGFRHAEDATPEEIAANFGWTQADIINALGDKDALTFDSAFGVKVEGNVSADNDAAGKWKGKNILFHAGAGDEHEFGAAKSKLLRERDRRAKPLIDEHVWVSENGLMLAALARGGTQLKNNQDLEAAKKLWDYLNLNARASKSRLPLHLAHTDTLGDPDDYSALALGNATFGKTDEAAKLLEAERKTFLDEKTGHFFAQPVEAKTLWIRTHLIDPAPGDPPSAETLSLLAYLQLKKTGDASPTLLAAIATSIKEANPPPRPDALLAISLLAGEN